MRLWRCPDTHAANVLVGELPQKEEGPLANTRGAQCSASGHPAPQRDVHASLWDGVMHTAHCVPGPSLSDCQECFLLHSQVGTTTAELVANFQPTL